MGVEKIRAFRGCRLDSNKPVSVLFLPCSWQKACIDAGRRVNIILAAVFVLALRAAGRKGDDVRPAKRVLLR